MDLENVLRRQRTLYASLTRDASLIGANLPEFVSGMLRLIESPFNAGKNDEAFAFNSENIVSVIKQVILTAATPLVLPINAADMLAMNIFRVPRMAVSYPGNEALAAAFPNEKWYFINGICTDEHGLANNCQRLESQFRRPVQGIYNKTYGFFSDLFESILQRNLDINTDAVKTAANVIYHDLINDKVDDIVLIAHSQGGIIASLVVDLLYKNPHGLHKKKLLKKLRVCTFASAADDFRNPDNTIPVIEHYVNERDAVAELGVLAFGYRPNYAGEIFLNSTGSGHFFNQFYSLAPEVYTSVKSRGAIPWLLNVSPQTGLSPIVHSRL
ncbi:uncharacterized protein VTP21DRAFT_762 [Calcarisporiella thermophila]|uniref:uncharacterized protein n=1 Tax=Calcarisporiella thermophila TaxID=911321 RepID=UPI003742F283